MRRREKAARVTYKRLLKTAAVLSVAGLLFTAFAHQWLSAPSSAAAITVRGFYLDVGASSSLGFQPTGIPHHNGHRTDAGYANNLVKIAQARGVSLTLRQVGCPGETAESMLRGGDHCYTLPDRQLVAATQYLRSHRTQVGLVTIDLGFNDIRTCMWPKIIDVACAEHGIARVNQDLPAVLHELKAAAGPRVHFVGVLYGDPFLSHFLSGGTGVAQAQASLRVMTNLNATLTKIFAKFGIPSANVPRAFQSDVTTITVDAPWGQIPENVARACSLTWMCQGYPYGPDDHPNNAGYSAIAAAIAAKLPKTW